MIPVIPTCRGRVSGSGVVLTVALVALLGAVYLALEAPLGDDPTTQSASEPAVNHTPTPNESS